MFQFKQINSTIKASTLYTVGNFFNKAIAFLMVPVFTRLLSTSEYGVVSTYASWVSMITVIISLGLSGTIRIAYIDYKNRIDRYISSITFLVFIVFIFVLCCAGVLLLTGNKTYIGVLVILCIIESFALFIQNIEMNKLMMDFAYVKRTLIMVLPNLISVITAWIILVFTSVDRPFARIIPEVVTQSLLALFLIYVFYKKDSTTVDVTIWKYGLSLSLPLIFHSLSSMILSNFDKTMITSLRNSQETGIYSTAYNFGMVVIAISSALDGVWIPWFTKRINEHDELSVNKVMRNYISVIATIVCCIMLIASDILKLITPKDYWMGTSLIPPIVLASFIIYLYSFAINAEYYYKKVKHIAINTFIAAIVNISLNYLLIPKYGALAAAWTTVIAYLVSLIMHLRNVKKINSMLFPIRDYLISIGIVMLCCIITYSFDNKIIIRFLFMIGILVLFVSKYYYFFKSNNK